MKWKPKYRKDKRNEGDPRIYKVFDNFNYDLRISIISDDREDLKVQFIITWEVIPRIKVISFL